MEFRIFGRASADPDQPGRASWVDLVLVAALVGVAFGIFSVAQEVTGPKRDTIEIDLSPWALFHYTLFSLSRGLVAYFFSLIFTLLYGYWAAKDRIAARVLIPLLDILQSIPVLAFMPGLVVLLVNLFPHSNFGLEMAAVLMIFTGQAWNMTFSFYHSVRSVPNDQQEAASMFKFNWWQRLKWVELPFSVMGLVWNSMMSMAGGWFFLMINESFTLGDQDYRLPGIGSYMSRAAELERYDCMAYAMLAMILMIVALDQFLWRPVVVWAQRFRVEEGGRQDEATSWFLDWLRKSRFWPELFHTVSSKFYRPRASRRIATPKVVATPSNKPTLVSLLLFGTLVVALCFGSVQLWELLRQVSWSEWCVLALGAACTLGRVLTATLLGTLWALPAGIAIGRSPKLSRILQPVVQVVASFPAPMLFPIVVAVLTATGVTLDYGSVVLMLLGTQWYILFNVIAGAMAIPTDLNEAAESFKVTGWQRFRVLYFPGVFPHLVTGWVTAAGGAWNASIVAEYMIFRQQELKSTGLGAMITVATKDKDFSLLAAAVLLMSLLVVTFNRFVWKRLYHLAETRYALTK